MNRQQDDKLLIIGEGLHILNPDFQQALEKQDPAALVQLAKQQISGGAMSLDINLGPAKSLADRLPWVVQTIQQHAAIPLFLPAVSSGLVQALHVHQGQATINAVTAAPDQLAETMKIARDFEANLVVLLTKPGLQNSETEHRLQIALEVLEQADAIDLPLDRLYLDPIFSVRTDPVAWHLTGGMPDLDPTLQILTLIGELSNQQAKTILALSNGTLGLATQKRSSLHCRMLPLLVDAGLHAVLLNCRDQTLMEVAGAQSIPLRLQQKAA